MKKSEMAPQGLAASGSPSRWRSPSFSLMLPSPAGTEVQFRHRVQTQPTPFTPFFTTQSGHGSHPTQGPRPGAPSPRTVPPGSATARGEAAKAPGPAPSPLAVTPDRHGRQLPPPARPPPEGGCARALEAEALGRGRSCRRRPAGGGGPWRHRPAGAPDPPPPSRGSSTGGDAEGKKQPPQPRPESLSCPRPGPATRRARLTSAWRRGPGPGPARAGRRGAPGAAPTGRGAASGRGEGKFPAPHQPRQHFLRLLAGGRPASMVVTLPAPARPALRRGGRRDPPWAGAGAAGGRGKARPGPAPGLGSAAGGVPPLPPAAPQPGLTSRLPPGGGRRPAPPPGAPPSSSLPAPAAWAGPRVLAPLRGSEGRRRGGSGSVAGRHARRGSHGWVWP